MFDEDDRQAAKDSYPNIFPALDHPELREFFAAHDVRANGMKRNSRRWGFRAVALVSLALIGASMTHFLGQPWQRVVAGVSAVAGILGAGLGVFGVMFAASKDEWLQHRFVTERLRQMHFQWLLAHIADIAEAAERKDWTALIAARAAALGQFKQQVAGCLSTLFDDAIELPPDESPRTGYAMDPAFIRKTTTKLPATDHVTELLDAYVAIRVMGQWRYASHRLKLRERSFISTFPREQARTLTALGIGAITLLVVLHIAAAIGVFFKSAVLWMPYADLLAMWLAIGALALRTVEEGLQPRREIERYRAYRAGIANIRQRLEPAKTPARRREIMIELEELAWDEMVNFLKSNQEARFVM
ncbi:hypothetical protein [Phenylobacterium sp.]|uniref:hypothetical protein n=1 Tax=Phenylobacterium sp. TaxID=1871053 RepID=UPI003563D875